MTTVEGYFVRQRFEYSYVRQNFDTELWEIHDGATRTVLGTGATPWGAWRDAYREHVR